MQTWANAPFQKTQFREELFGDKFSTSVQCIYFETVTARGASSSDLTSDLPPFHRITQHPLLKVIVAYMQITPCKFGKGPCISLTAGLLETLRSSALPKFYCCSKELKRDEKSRFSL